MTVDPHRHGQHALVAIVKEADAALRQAVGDLQAHPDSAVKAITIQCGLLSKATAQLARRMDTSPPPERLRNHAPVIDIADIRELLDRIAIAAQGGLCPVCRAVRIEPADD